MSPDSSSARPEPIPIEITPPSLSKVSLQRLRSPLAPPPTLDGPPPQMEMPPPPPAKLEAPPPPRQSPPAKEQPKQDQQLLTDVLLTVESLKIGLEELEASSAQSKEFQAKSKESLQDLATSSDVQGIRLDALHKQLELLTMRVEQVAQTTQSAAAKPKEPEKGADDEILFNVELNKPPGMNFGLDELLKVVIKHGASDLHLKAGAPPTVRLNGELVAIGEKQLNEAECRYLVFQSIPKAKRRRFVEGREVDHAYVSNGVRFRLNAFLERSRVSAAFRMVTSRIPPFQELGLPPVLGRLASLHHGLVLVTGPAGSGKSTTLASMIDFINKYRKCHIVTIEDPIEFYHADELSFITQREVGTDTAGFAEALRQALRQDPNVIMVGEMRDTETILTAVTAAETGHLVLSTLHTPNTVSAIDRIVDAFSGDQQKQIRMLLSSSLRGVVSQKLLQRADQKGRIPALEVLVCTPTISSHVLDGQTKEIYQYIEQGAHEGMQTFTHALARLVEQGLVTKEEAIFHAADQANEFRLATRQGHMQASAMPGQADGNYLNWL